MNPIRYITGFFGDAVVSLKNGLGRSLREAGLSLDKRGSKLTHDAACLEPLNRHRNILNLYQRAPVLSNTTYVAPNATLIGDVLAGANTHFGFGSVVKADNHAVRVGNNTRVGDNAVLECAEAVAEEAFPASLNIGNNVTIEQGCHLTSCIVDDNVHIGFKSVVQEGAQLERGCVIAPNSYVPAGSLIPENTLWEGTPVHFVRVLDAKEREQSTIQNKDVKLQLD